MHGKSCIYHHTPEHAGLEPSGWGALELARSDRKRGIAGVFRLSDPAEPAYTLRLKGVNPGWKYKVQFDNEGTTATCDGYQLKYEGVTIHLDGPLTSQLLLMEAEETD